MSTPSLHLQTLFELDNAGRILRTREPGGGAGPLFSLIRGPAGCAWAVRADVPADIAAEIDALARSEPPITDLQRPPRHATHYLTLLAGEGREPAEADLWAGPAFTFPETIEAPAGVTRVTEERLLQRHFHGWVAGEIAAGRAPVMAICVEDSPVSICFCARRSEQAAEAGLETAAAFRGRGYGPQVTAAWALAVRASGRIPLYSTSWANGASLRIAQKLKLQAYACGWNVTWRSRG